MRLAIVFITLFMANILSGQPTHSGYLNVNQEKSEASASYANDDRREVLVQEIRGNVHASAFAAQDTLEVPQTDAVKTLKKKPLLEVFTSSSCGPSASFNSSQLLPFLNSYEDEVTFIRYPMNWPTPPDPYYTAEGGIRRTYYAVSAVPYVFINGTNVVANHTAILNAFQYAQASAAVLSLSAAHQIVANTLHARIRIEPNEAISGLQLRVAVIEKTTHNNATTNGETSFRNVLMKFAPNAEGNPLNIQANQSQSFTFEQSLVNTNIEEIDDLEVVIFVQDNNKNVLQSAYSTTGFNVSVASSPSEGGLVTGSGIYAPGEMVALEATPNAGFSFQKWTLNGVTVSHNTAFSFEMPAENQLYTAHFVPSCEHTWTPLPNLQYNMQIVAQILINGQVSLNPNDVVGAFVGNECRGIGSPSPELNGIIFLTVSSNIASDEQVELKIWKSNECSDCNAIPGFAFVNQAEIGTFLEPYQVRCGAIQEITFGQGYTWFSLNVNPGSMSPNSLFTTLTPCYDDRVIGQTSFALFTGSSWIGSLTSLGLDKMYRMKLCSQQSLSLMGDAAPLNPINLATGYTWLGYSPQECLPINEALANLSPAPAYNDRLIGQSSFALYTGTQWIGTLTTLCPDAGYVIRLSNTSTLNWPAIVPVPVAAFTASITTGMAPLTVNFTDQSSNNPTSWLWDFGDGNTSSTQNPAHTYQTAGSFTVQLTVSNGSGGSDTETKIDYITATENTLWPPGTVHCTGTPTAIVDVTNPITGKTWMDRNLGASQAATSSTDELAYGDLYQWGRFSDGHQCRNSATTTTLSSTDTPGHGEFILAPNNPWDWRSPQNNNLWLGANGINNPCPSGYRLPTDSELDNERLTWSSNNASGAFNSPLKLPLAGYRSYSNAAPSNNGVNAIYWSATVSGTYLWSLDFYSSHAAIDSYWRASGLSVRCIKDTPEPTLYNLNLEVNPANSGSVTGAGAYQSSTAITITATPNQGWEFVNWTGDVAYLDNPGSATANVIIPEANVSLTATFQEETGLWPPGTVHCSGTPTAIVDVTNPVTGKTWMDRNLGASQAATSSTDELAYGDLYQWGRFADGHQCRNSATTTTLSSTDTPGHGNFILILSAPYDWRSAQNNDFWQGINGINNPCPVGYRLPTQAEIDSERASWTSNNSTGAITSSIKLPMAGYRDYGGGSISGLGLHGAYWSSGVDLALLRAYDLYIVSNEAFIGSNNRGSGFSVRCLKSENVPTLYNLNIEVSPINTGSVTGAGAYQSGTAVTITATPNQGWEFVNWTGDVAYMDNPNAATATVTMPEANVSLTANFQEESNTWPPGTVHCSGTPTAIVDVTNPVTGKTWMDRNLGASQAATSSTDELAYGDLYQWGRFSDGHQCRNSGTTTTLSSTDMPGHGNFIPAPSEPYDWRSPQNDNLWQGVIGTNNPCPIAYRLPTDTELNAERQSWSSNNPAGAFDSPLKLPVAGYRSSDGYLHEVSVGNYWSSTVIYIYSQILSFFDNNASVGSSSRASGGSVRCIKDTPGPTLYNLNIEVNPSNAGSVTGAGAYHSGTAVTINATPNQGWEFVNWTGDVVYLDNPNTATATVTMPEANVSLTANFQEESNPWPPGTVHCTGTPTAIGDVTNPVTGKTWMDRNLGAVQAATSSTDELAYGDLYQWGRFADGHQCRNSATTTTLSSTDTPGHGDFILSAINPMDWRTTQNSSLWQGVNGINNPCPQGYRVPTLSEMNEELTSWSNSSAAGAYASMLKLSMSGFRGWGSGELAYVNTYGAYWSATVIEAYTWYLAFSNPPLGTMTNYNRAGGLSVRCIKD